MRMIHRVVIWLVVVAAVLAPIGAQGAKESVKPAESVVEVVIWHSNSGLAGEAMTALVADFNATVGVARGIVVREIFQGKAADVATKLRSALQAERKVDLPDLAQLDATGVMDVRDSNLLVSASELIARDPSFDIGTLEPAAVWSMTYRDLLLGMPFNSSTILLYYNKDAFREAGLDPDFPPATLAELATFAGKLVKRSPDGKTVLRYGFAGVPTTYELVSWIGQQHGLSYMTDQENGHAGDPTKVVFDSDGTLANFLKAWRSVYQSGGLGNLTTNVRQEFVAGKVAMHVASTSGLSTLLAAIEGRFELGVGRFPKVDETATGGVNIGGGAIFAFDNGNDPGKTATWEFLKYLMGPQAQFTWHKATGYFPVNLATYALPEFQRHIEANPLFKVAIDQLHESNPRLQSVWWPNSYQAYYEIQNRILEMLEKGVGIDETVASLAGVLNRYMEDYNRMNRP